MPDTQIELLREVLALCDDTTDPVAALAAIKQLVTDYADNFYLDVEACTDNAACARRGCADCERSYGPQKGR